MSFLYPHFLWALLLPLALGGAALLRHRRAGSAWRLLVSPAHEGELVRQRAPWHRLLGCLFGLLALVSAIIATARPINGYGEAGVTAGSRNLLLALDVSRSMETQDVSPSRLEEARAAAFELIEALPEDKIGLIIFSGEADLVVPLTYDHTALRDALEQVDRTWAPGGGTDFNKVLRKALQDFERSAPEGTNALVLLSDGEDTTDSGTSLANEAKEKQLLVIAVGIGTEAGGPIPDPAGENGLWQDAEGKHVISKRDTASLQQFAQATGGDFFAMSPRADLTAFARHAVRKLATHEEEFSLNKVPNDLFAYPAAAALLLLVLSILAATDWHRAPRRLRLLPLWALALLLGAQAQAAPAPESLGAYRVGLSFSEKDPDTAKEWLSQALLDSDTELQAAAYYAIGNSNTQATFRDLRKLYEQPAPADDDSEDKTAAPQQGPSAKALQGIVDALREDEKSYDNALRLNPQLKQAAANKAKVEELIKALEEEIKRRTPPSDNERNQEQNNEQNEQNDNEEQQQGDQSDNNREDNREQQGDQGDSNRDDNQEQQGDQDKDKQDPQQNDRDKDKQDDRQQGQQGDDKQPPPQQDQDNAKPDDNEQNTPDKQPKQPPPAAQEPEEQNGAADKNDKEKQEQRAASILQMHVDEEEGSPIPHLNLPPRPPKKDY